MATKPYDGENYWVPPKLGQFYKDLVDHGVEATCMDPESKFNLGLYIGTAARTQEKLVAALEKALEAMDKIDQENAAMSTPALVIADDVRAEARALLAALEGK